MTLYFTINSPHQWVSLDSKGIHDSGEVDSLSDLSFAGQHCVAVVPGEQVATREIVMPVRNRQKLMAAIPFAIEDSLISRVDDLHFTLLNVGAENKVAFAYVSRDVLSGWLEQINQAGIVVNAVIPDYLLLPQSTPSSAVISSSGDGRILLRSGMYQGAVTDLEKLSIWLQEQDSEMPLVVDRTIADQLPDEMADRITLAQIGGHLHDWLSAGPPVQNAVLLSGDFSQGKKRSRLRQYWPAVAMLALAGFIKLGSDISEIVWLEKSQARLESKTQTLYQKLFPGARLLPGRARAQTKNKLQSLQSVAGGNDFTFLLVTTAGLLANQRATLEELDYREGQLTAVLTLNDFSHLDKVRQRLQKDPSINVSVKQSGARGNKVQARFVISRAAS